MKPWNAEDLDFDADTFSGVARLFPLPNLVLYPHVMQPLHIFEERYRELVEDALAGDKLIAMAVLEPGWETDYESRPPVSKYACLGKIVAHHRLPDGRYNLLLLGVQRVRIIEELNPLRSFRQASVALLDDDYDFDASGDMHTLQEKLLTAFRNNLPCECETPEQLEKLMTGELPLGLLTDLAAYALPLETEVKQELLAECSVTARAHILLSQLDELELSTAPAPREFPPRFSAN
jgi:Lon protease-like protein